MGLPAISDPEARGTLCSIRTPWSRPEGRPHDRRGTDDRHRRLDYENSHLPDNGGAVMETFLAELVFPGLARSVSVARHCVRSVLTAAGHQNVDDALLVVSELVGNAVVHTVSGLAGGLVTVDVREIGQNMTRIDVIDQGASTAPQVCESGDTASSGRGLRLVEETAVRWGVRDDSLGGRAVWAEVLTTVDAPAAVIAASPTHTRHMPHAHSGGAPTRM
jgi:anti-sigma regulatory factor (Ser/Thr protein kinase)